MKTPFGSTNPKIIGPNRTKFIPITMRKIISEQKTGPKTIDKGMFMGSKTVNKKYKGMFLTRTKHTNFVIVMMDKINSS